MSFLGLFAEDQPVLAAFLNASVRRRDPVKLHSWYGGRPTRRVFEEESEDEPSDGRCLGVSAAMLRQFMKNPEISPLASTTEVCTSIVLPATRSRKCAYTDLLRSQRSGDGRPLTAPATVFVSHAWRYSFKDVVEVMLTYDEEQRSKGVAATYFWFDLFTNNQNDTASAPPGWFATTFRQQIGNIGTTLLVLMPWNDPVPLTRAWCLWEILCTIQENSALEIRLPQAQRELFRQCLISSFKKVMDSFVNINAERADAWQKKDRDMIFKAVRDTVSFTTLNATVKDQLRDWVLRTAEELLVELEGAGGGWRDRKKREGEVAKLSLSLGALSAQLGHYDRALELYKRARDIYDRQGNKRAASAVYLNTGLVYGSKKEPKQVITFLTKALALGQSKPADKANCSIALGNAHLDRGDDRKALAMFSDALDALVQVHGEKHRQVAFAHCNVAVACLSTKDLTKAAAHYRSAMNISREVEGPTHPHTADAMHGLSVALLRAGNAEEAIHIEQQALNAYRENFGAQHPFTTQAEDTLAAARAAAARRSAAERTQRRAEEPPAARPTKVKVSMRRRSRSRELSESSDDGRNFVRQRRLSICMAPADFGGLGRMDARRCSESSGYSNPPLSPGGEDLGVMDRIEFSCADSLDYSD